MFRPKRNNSTGGVKGTGGVAPRPKRNNSTGTLKSRQEDLRDRSSSSHKKRSSVPTSPPPPPKERLFAGRKSKLASSFSLSPNTRSLRLFKRSSTGSDKEESYPNDNGEQPKTPTKSSSRKSRFSLRAAYLPHPPTDPIEKSMTTMTTIGNPMACTCPIR